MPDTVILCDPPWWYNNRSSESKTKFGGGAIGHYPLMKDQQLLDMDAFVSSISTKNTLLLMWATMPRLDFACQLIKHWGFRYCTTGFVWIKTKRGALDPIYGPGYYTASNAEVCLIGVKGSMKPKKMMLPSVLHQPRGRHSEKPKDVHLFVECAYPDSTKIELFAREGRPGWMSWGMTGDMTSPGWGVCKHE